jgi:Mg2+-importing ATPase
MYLPFSPLAGMLGFTPLPFNYFVFVAVATVVYLLLVEAAKRVLLHRATHNQTARRGNSLLAAT